MESEALRNIRTMRHVKTSLEVARRQRIRTTNSLFKSPEEARRLEATGLNDGITAHILAAERARAAKFDASVARSRGKLLGSREKMARLINRNRALTELRHQIQRERDNKKSAVSGVPVPDKPKPVYEELHQIELKY
ncbi:MAG: hypothetical protein JXA46_16225 [Dehalococcoidales bacterium]|nr:hypothetical protein [Dehalococcoidales bacterium]